MLSRPTPRIVVVAVWFQVNQVKRMELGFSGGLSLGSVVVVSEPGAAPVPKVTGGGAAGAGAGVAPGGATAGAGVGAGCAAGPGCAGGAAGAPTTGAPAGGAAP